MPAATWDHEADFVVVGAGTAGCVLANRLSADAATQVLLLEAGGSDAHPLVRMPAGFTRVVQRPALNWGYASEPELALGGRVIRVPRGRVLGGSSSINGMFHIRGDRRDFGDWAAAGCTGWAYADVLPYFVRSESNWRARSRGVCWSKTAAPSVSSSSAAGVCGACARGARSCSAPAPTAARSCCCCRASARARTCSAWASRYGRPCPASAPTWSSTRACRCNSRRCSR
jgi:choline dehydrogenase-like flavoprotein